MTDWTDYILLACALGIVAVTVKAVWRKIKRGRELPIRIMHTEHGWDYARNRKEWKPQ